MYCHFLPNFEIFAGPQMLNVFKVCEVFQYASTKLRLNQTQNIKGS
jgi:hypothetical protein